MSPSEAQRRGMRLAAARKLKGLDQTEAGNLIGVSRTTVSGWENGEPIDEVWMPSIVRVYGGSKSWVRYGEGVAPVGYLDDDNGDYPGESPAKYPKTPKPPPLGGAEKPPIKRRRKGNR